MRAAMKQALGAVTMAVALSTVSTGLAAAQGAIADHVTPSGAYDQERLGPLGMHKCRAYRKVRKHSDEMQAADHGQLSPGDTKRLMAELSHVRHSAPVKLTPADCGVPL